MAIQSNILQQYDHRIREAICRTGNPCLFPDLKIPYSTIRSWLSRGCPEVVTHESIGKNELQLHEEIAKLKKKVAVLIAVLRVVTTLLRVSGFRLDKRQRLPERKFKLAILKSIERDGRALPTKSILGIAHLSAARYNAWKRLELDCGLDDRSSCPHTSPSQLLPKEVVCIKEIVTSDEYRHMPISSLALFTQRIGKVFASATSWAKLIREHGWRRPRQRLYPAKPKVGVRATKPNEYWHLDVTVIKMLDGTEVYLHSVIDNFSRSF